jgi:hypothetical protein
MLRYYGTYNTSLLGGSVDIMVVVEVFTSTCKPDKNRILQEARRNPNELDNNPRRHVGSRR